MVAGVAPPTASHADTAAAFATVAATLQPAPRAWAQRWLRGAPSSRSTCSAPSPRKLLSIRGLNTFEFEMLSSTQWVFCVGTFRLYRAQSFVQSPFLEY